MATAGYRRQAGAPALYIRQVLRLYIGPAVVKCVQICCSPSQAPSGYIQLGAGCPATQCERSRGSLSGRRHAVADSVRAWPGAPLAVTNGHIRQFWVPLGSGGDVRRPRGISRAGADQWIREVRVSPWAMSRYRWQVPRPGLACRWHVCGVAWVVRSDGRARPLVRPAHAPTRHR
jgi:hypothetical protein